MKKVYFAAFLILAIFSNTVFSQQKYVVKKLNEIEGKWKLNEFNHVEVQKVAEFSGLQKDFIFDLVYSYIINDINKIGYIIQDKNKENGVIIARGIFPKFFINNNAKYYLTHLLKIDIKDEKARFTISMIEYDVLFKEFVDEVFLGASPITYLYPINQKKGVDFRNTTGQIFYEAVKISEKEIYSIEEFIKSSKNTDKNLNNW